MTDEDFSLMENEHRKLKEENKVFNSKLKVLDSNHRQFTRELENLNVDSNYEDLLELEKKIILADESVGKLVEAQKKKYMEIKIEAMKNKEAKMKNNIEKIKFRNNQVVLQGEKQLKIKNESLAEVIKKISDYEKLISGTIHDISLGVKRYDEDAIEDFEDQISKYEERIGRLNSKISDLEYKRSDLENKYNSRRNTEYSDELNEELDDIHNKIGETNQELISHLDGVIQDCRDSISDYEDEIRKIQDIVYEDERKLTEEEMKKAKQVLPLWRNDLVLESENKINLEKEIKPLKETINTDKEKKVDVIKLQVAIHGNLVEILNNYTGVRADDIITSKDRIIYKYKNKKNKSIKDHLKILFKKVTL